jgi:hypothetical protein
MRIIKAIGATLAVVAVVATMAAAQDRDSGRDRDDHSRSFYATTKQNLLLNFSERRPDVIDASVAGGADGGSLDNPRFLYASVETNGIVTAVLEGTTVKLKAEAADLGGNETVDVGGLDNIGRTTSVTLDAPLIGVDFPASADEQHNQFIDGNLNPGTPMVVGSAYTN